MEQVERLSQAYSQAPWRKQLQIVGLFLLVVVFIALIASIYLNVSARSAAIGREIQRTQSRLLSDEQQIADLKAQLGTLYSASEMEKRARALGFETVKPDETLFLPVSGYMPRQPARLAPVYQAQVVGANVLPAGYTESLFVWLQKQFNQIVFPLFKVRP
jgi:cell division protein FtsL